MNVLRDSTTVPDGGWRYPGVNGFTVETRNYSQLYWLVKQHYEANQQAAPSEQEVIDYLCSNLFVPCYDSETRQPMINRFTQGLPTAKRGCCSDSKS